MLVTIFYHKIFKNAIWSDVLVLCLFKLNHIVFPCNYTLSLWYESISQVCPLNWYKVANLSIVLSSCKKFRKMICAVNIVVSTVSLLLLCFVSSVGVVTVALVNIQSVIYKLVVGNSCPWRLHECSVPRMHWRYKYWGGHTEAWLWATSCFWNTRESFW